MESTYPIKERVRLCEAQNWRCAYCGIRMYSALARSDDQVHHCFANKTADIRMRTATLDHIVPKCRNNSVIDNAIAACWCCNNLRGDVDALEWYDVVQWLISIDKHPLIDANRKERLYPQSDDEYNSTLGHARNLKELLCMKSS